MTIAPLPLGVLATTGAAGSPRGSSSDSSTSTEGEGATTDAFAALVAAVLAAGTPAAAPTAGPTAGPTGGPTGELDVQGDSDVLTLPTGSADVALAPVVADASVTGARAAGVSGGLAGDVTESLSAPGSPATALPLAQPDGLVVGSEVPPVDESSELPPDAVRPPAQHAETQHAGTQHAGTQHAEHAEPARPSAPAEAARPQVDPSFAGTAAVALAPVAGGAPDQTSVAAGVPVDVPVDVPGDVAGGEAPVLQPIVLPPALAAALAVTAPPAAPIPTAAPPAVGGAQATVPTPAPVDQAPLAPAPAASGEQATDALAKTVDHSPLTATATPATGGEQATETAPPSVDHAPLTPTATITPATSGEQATETAPPSVDHAPPTPAADQPATDQPRTDQPRTDQPRTDQPRTDQPRVTPSADPQAVTFVQAPGTTAATATSDRPVTQVTQSAAAQVVPELTRLVQAGPGTHRMVLRLDPEHLGDVRITLTVHPGGVRVRMATGSEDARATLHEGLPALQRALESMTGRPAGETQLSVLHQAQATGQQAASQSGSQGGNQAGGQPDPQAYDGDNPPLGQTDAGASDHQTPGERPQAEHRAAGRPAGTQVDTTARDGSQGAGTPRPADPPTSDASRRLDVSM